ncbi:hypothetical protein ACWDTI_09435 [Gordonia sp. NPDC003424]
MSAAADSAHVRIMLADYAAVDGAQKLNMIGGGATYFPLNAATGHTAPMGVIASASFDPQYTGESPAVELWLEGDDGVLVDVPGPPRTQPQFLRVGAAEPLRANIPTGLVIPHSAVRPRVQFVMHFGSGLPLTAGKGYQWRMQIDGTTHDEWTEPFFVVMPTVGATFG